MTTPMEAKRYTFQISSDDTEYVFINCMDNADRVLVQMLPENLIRC